MTTATAVRRGSRNWALARFAIAGLVLVAILFLFVFPTRSLLAQRRTLEDTRDDVSVLEEQNARLESELQRLQTPEEIERLAREQYHMVRPGEEAYVVVPGVPPATTTTVAPAQP